MIMRFLKSLRKEKGWTQQEVANLLGIERSTYTRYETGASEPNFEILEQLSRIFDVSTDVLIGRSAIPTPSGGVRIPVLGDVAAGIPIEAVTDIVDYEEIDAALAKPAIFSGSGSRAPAWSPG